MLRVRVQGRDRLGVRVRGQGVPVMSLDLVVGWTPPVLGLGGMVRRRGVSFLAVFRMAELVLFREVHLGLRREVC